LEDLETSQKERWISGAWNLKRRLERAKHLVQLKLNGQLVVGICLQVYFMKDLRLTIASIFIVQTEQKLWQKLLTILNSITLNGSLMIQECYQSQALTRLKRKKFNKKIPNQREHSNLEKEGRTVHSSR
jgi:hypothetical protein